MKSRKYFWLLVFLTFNFLICLNAPGYQKLQVSIDDHGQLQVKVNDEVCLTDFGILVAAPGWTKVYGKGNCRKITRSILPGRNLTKVSGKIINGDEYASFETEAEWDEKRIKLNCQLKVEKDFEVEVVRLSGLLPCENNAGTARWYILGTDKIRTGIFPAQLSADGDFGDSDFQWFGWALKSGAGIEFTPDWRGITGMYVQDGRRWGGNYFQVCWPIANKGMLHKGNFFECTIIIQPIDHKEIVQKAFKLGKSMLSLRAVSLPTDENKFEVIIDNLIARERLIDFKYKITDNIFTALESGSKRIKLAPLGSFTEEIEMAALRTPQRIKTGLPKSRKTFWEMGYPIEQDYRVFVQAWDNKNRVGEKFRKRFKKDILTGLRNEISLNGQWDFLPVPRGELIYPPPREGWQLQMVPSPPFSGGDTHKFWFRRKFTVPGVMRNKIIKLKFMAVNFEAKVYLNGKYAGDHFGGFTPFLIDVTDFVNWEGENELCVAVTDWTSACIKEIIPFELQPREREIDYLWRKYQKCIIAPIGGWFVGCGIWQDVYLVAYPKFYIEDVFVITSVRKREIRVQVRIRNCEDINHSLTVENLIIDKGRTVKPLKPLQVTIEANSTQSVEIREKWENPKLWSLNSPHLYNLVTKLKEKDREIDYKVTRFGFREFWTEGYKFVLNGVPVNLFATSGWGAETEEAAIEQIERARKANCRIMRLHTQPWQPIILDVADELGLLIIDEAAVYCYASCYAIDKPQFWDNYAQHLRELALRDRNHPSLVMYSLENEILHCGGGKEFEEGLAKLSQVVRAVDPTRLVTYEADLDPEGQADVIGLHYPHEYYSGYYLFPEEAYWLAKEETVCDGRKWKWKKDKPLYIGEFGLGLGAGTHHHSVFLGDEVYINEKKATEAFKRGLEFYIQAYRYYGVSGMCPWIFGDDLVALGKKAFSPLCVNIREYDHNFYGGNLIKRTLVAHNDLFQLAKLELKWQVKIGNQSIKANRLKFKLPPAGMKICSIAFRAPTVKKKTPLVFAVQLYKDGKLYFHTERQYYIFPNIEKITTLKTVLGVYDRIGKTRAILDRLKVKYWQINDLSKPFPTNLKVLILGYWSLDKETEAGAPKIAEFVYQGGRVICFEQKNYPKWLPMPVNIELNHSATITFKRANGHPILKEIKEEDLKFWHPDNIVARYNFVKPTKGNFRAIIDAGGKDGLNYSPLMEIFYGRGFYLLSQLELTTKFDAEPAAGILFNNLLKYAALTPHREPIKCALLADPESSLKRTLDSLSLVYDVVAGKLSQGRLSDYGLLIIGGNLSIWQEISQNKLKIKEFVQSGGIAWLHNLEPDVLSIVKEITGLDISLSSAPVEPLVKATPDQVTSGLSNHEFFWHEQFLWDRPMVLRPKLKYICSVPANSTTKMLTQPAGLIKVQRGKGFFLIDQILWDTEERNRTQAYRLASILLTNLGATLELSPFKPVKLEEYFQVDLKPFCNMGFQDEVEGDKKGGWTDQGKQDMRYFPVGFQIMHNIPFQIIDPGLNAGKSCIVLKGNYKPYFPKEVKGIKVGKSTTKLYFLHTCAWGWPEGAEAAKYVIHYQDGTKIELPLRVNIEIRDWFSDPEPIPRAEIAWQGKCLTKSGQIAVYSMEWTNPYPDKIINSIDFVSAENDPVPVLIAITGHHTL